MTAELWPESDPRAFAELESVFEDSTLPEVSILFAPKDIPREEVRAWMAAHRKPAKTEIWLVYDES